MKVIVFGATGMVGQGVLREALLDPGVDEVLVIGRTPTGQEHRKLRELNPVDMYDLGPIDGGPDGSDAGRWDACFFCLGVSSVGMSEADYRRVTYDLTLSIAGTLAAHNPDMTFVYVSGAGTDSTESGRRMWARVKGATENALLAMPWPAYMFRPAYIQPVAGVRSKTRWYAAMYAVVAPFYPLIRRLGPGIATTTEQLGRAMLTVARTGAPKHVLESRDINAL